MNDIQGIEITRGCTIAVAYHGNGDVLKLVVREVAYISSSGIPYYTDAIGRVRPLRTANVAVLPSAPPLPGA